MEAGAALVEIITDAGIDTAFTVPGESFLPVLEAMSHGCPVICSNSSSLPEVYGNAALSFNPNSEENLEECINNFLNNTSLKDKMIESGYQRVKNFSWKKCAEETSKIYKSLI